jgi:hypothetical protein
MVMVSTSDSSQCRAVAVPCAWKARRRGCEGDNRGGSVVLQCPAQHVHSRWRRKDSTHPLKGYKIYQIMRRRGPCLRACLDLGEKGPRLQVEVCGGRGVDCGAREWGERSGGSFICRSRRVGSTAGTAAAEAAIDGRGVVAGRRRSSSRGHGSGRGAALRCIA